MATHFGHHRFLAVLATALVAGSLQAQTCPFDDGTTKLTREGVILTRYALGVRGAPLLAGTDLAVEDPNEVDITVNCPACGLDINGNGSFDITDATIISRKLAGLRGAALTANLALGSGTRNTPAAVSSFLLAGCGTTGGTVTSITAGNGLSGGTITASGTISVAPFGIGTSELDAGAVTNSKLASGSVTGSKIADLQVTQAKLSVSGNDASGNLLSTNGTTLVWTAPPALSCTNAISAATDVGAGANVCISATCPSGYTATGGGVAAMTTTNSAAATQTLTYASSASSATSWRNCYANYAASGTLTVTVAARCCKVD